MPIVASRKDKSLKDFLVRATILELSRNLTILVLRNKPLDKAVFLLFFVCTSTHSKSRSLQARNQDFMWGGGGGANEAKVDQTTEMYFLLSDPFI